MKTLKIIAITLMFTFCMPSCIGSFKLTKSVYEWNQEVGSKFANEVVFLAFCVTAYPVCIAADVLILNTIEFWSDEQVFSLKNGEIKEIIHDGIAYKITKKRKSCRVEEVNNANNYAELSYNKANKTWSIKNNHYDENILRLLDNNKVEVYLPNDQHKIFNINEEGLAELKKIVSNDPPLPKD